MHLIFSAVQHSTVYVSENEEAKIFMTPNRIFYDIMMQLKERSDRATLLFVILRIRDVKKAP